MTKSQILILSHPLDSHIPYVTKHLNQQDVIVINPLEEILQGRGIDYKFADNTLDILYDNVLIRDIKSVWYRKTSAIDPKTLPIAKDKIEYADSALYTQVSSLAYLFPDAFWMSDRSNVWRANSKPLQLKIASEIGFNVPETLFASTAKPAREFVEKHGRCIAKTQATKFPPHTIVFAKLIQQQDNLDFQGLRFDPYIFQQYIEPAYELRVTVVENKVFAAKVFGDETDGISSSYRDWRYSHVNDSFGAEKATLSQAVSRQCISLVKKLGLTYGAIDLIVDKKGKVWFLEINPNGQWAFVEQYTNQPIGKAIADCLQRERI